jgi:uncharacterized hydantoinase/oxoprolinase family protein
MMATCDEEIFLCEDLTKIMLSLSSSARALKEISNIARIVNEKTNPDTADGRGGSAEEQLQQNQQSTEQRKLLIEQLRILDQSLRHLEEKVDIVKEIIKEEYASLQDLETVAIDPHSDCNNPSA